MSEKKRDYFQAAVLIVSVLFLTAIFVLVFNASKNLSEGYRAIVENNLDDGLTGSLLYDDHFYGQIMFGIEIVPEDLNKV